MADQQLLFQVPEPGKPRVNKPSKRVNRELAKKRYYFHRCLGEEFELLPVTRVIKTRYKAFTEIPIGQRYYIGKLIEIGYNVQYELL